jgi:hypothetical protein
VEKAYNILLEKLEHFIRRYYLNQMIRGGLLIAALLLASYLLVATSAFYGDLSSLWRGILFYSFILLNGGVLLKLVMLPWLRRMGLIARMSYREAAILIGQHFPEVKDKLLNTIDLHDLSEDSGSRDLLLASIEQRTFQLQPIPFQQMIDLGKNRKYLRILLPVAGVFLVVLFAAPSVIKEGGTRVLQYQQYFAPIAPFDFILENEKLVVEKAGDLDLQLRTSGSEIPQQVYVEFQEYSYRMEGVKKGNFQYKLKNLQKSTRVRFKANKFYSAWYEIKVVPKPLVSDFEVQLNYPAYLGKTNERLQNIGDLMVPEGTVVKWSFRGADVDELQLRLSNGTIPEISKPSKGSFQGQWKAMEPVNYAIYIANKQNPRNDSMLYGIQVIPDAFPTIIASEAVDSVQRKLRYFSGEIADDYGFSSLNFVYQRFSDKGQAEGELKREKLSIGKFSRQQFYHFFDAAGLGLSDGAYVEYYFEVADNDGVNGAKKARSETFSFKSLTEKETKSAISANAGAVEKQLQEAINDAKSMQQELDKLRRKLKENKDLSWEDRKQLEQLQQKQQSIQDKLQDATQKMNENKELRSEQEKPTDLMQKQQQLQEMAEKLLNDDIKKMMDELQKMMEQKMNKDQLQSKLDQMKLSEKDVEKELDRMLEFFKQMEVEQKTLEAADKLDQLAKEQEQLEQQQNKSAEELEQKQKELNEKFDDLQKDIDELEKKNDALEDPNELGDLKEESKEISDKMDEAKADLQKKQKKEASKKQKSAAEQMKQMAKGMREKMDEAEMEQLEENMQALRMLLENLIKFSFNQEDLMDRLRENSNYSPVYVEIGKDQFKLKEEAKLIEDSLLALSKRIIQLESTVNKEMGLVNDNLEKAVDHLSNRQTPQAKTRQQYAMTSVNNLAVLLSELLKQMQQEMAQKMEGDQQCKKPGGSSQSKMSKLSQLQKSLNEQMKAMEEGMKGKDGKKPGGESGSGGKDKQMSQGFGEMVAKQEAIRRELQKLSQEMNKDGQGSMGDLDKLAKEMEKTEKELVNKMLTRESMKRQEEIMTRLLEAEKAEREREFDNKRESNTAKEVPRTIPPGFEAYRRQKLRTLEMYRTVSPELNSFYKQKVDQYFLQLNR